MTATKSSLPNETSQLIANGVGSIYDRTLRPVAFHESYNLLNYIRKFQHLSHDIDARFAQAFANGGIGIVIDVSDRWGLPL